MKKPTLALLAALSALVLLYSRRGSTLTNPQVWSEDGYFIVPQFLASGWATMAEPVQGYLISISRIISNASLTIAPNDYPFVSTLLAWLFTAAVAAFIAVAPTLLKGRYWLALACFLIPADPEAFGTPLYTFWWAGIILFLLPLWERTSSHFGLRVVTLLLCGLSSPLIVLATPLMALRAYLLRHRVDYWLLAISILCTFIQVWLILSGGGNAAAPEISWLSLQLTIEKFFGLFVVDSSYLLDEFVFMLGAAVLAVTAFAAWSIRDRWVSVGLLYFLAGTIALSLARVDMEIIDPVTAGPRYFFYPYIVLAWLLIQSITHSKSPILGRAVFATILLAALGNAFISGWSRTHDDIQWERHVASCTHFESYSMPIQTTGERNNTWVKEYPREACERLAINGNDTASSLYPFTIDTQSELVPQQLEDSHVPNDSIQVVSQNIDGTNYSRSAPEGFYPLGSLVTDDADTGSVTLAIQKGTQLLFTSGPGGSEQRYTVNGDDQAFTGRLPVCIEWCTLNFSSDLLPDEFTVELADDGSTWGEWFAIGLPQ